MKLLILETNRLILTGISTEDMAYIFNHFPKEQIMVVLGHRSENDYLKEEQKHQNGYASYNRRFLMFLLTDKESGQIIGRCGIHNWNKDHHRAEIGYVMEDENFKRKALMSEAVEAIIEYGFKVLNLNRIEAMVGLDNVPSLRILEKNGFKEEGRLREHVRSAEGFSDTLLLSVLSKEYEAKLQKLSISR
ncbi:MAG: GNAT family N-acetyltransferase [Bacteroidetes bacterium]|nr:GNAT family N-acetyltransferase [Bacteroidota bacterium]